MTTHYILFVHGVNTREVREKPTYADNLFRRIQENISSEGASKLKQVALYWGDVNVDAENQLLKTLRGSSLWEKMWFRTFREQQLLQFAGDAALYISRYIGAKVVRRLKEQAVDGLRGYQPNDRLHLVTHSWGTVILFDLLFANRWESQDVPGHDDVMAIRDVIYGLSGGDRAPLKGIKIASINTMGSPIAIFSLTDVTPGRDGDDSPSSHDITPQLQKLLNNLHNARNGEKLPWRNFIHPGDPIAYPLSELMTSLADGERRYLDIQDIITDEAGVFDFLTEPFSQTVLALVHGGDAHGSYWKNEKVAQEISSFLLKEPLP